MAEYTVERLAAREEIRDVVYLYCRAIDRRQFHWMQRVFHEGGRMLCGPYDGGVEGFIDMLAERHAQIPRATHMVGNILFDFVGDDRAFVESYCLAIEEFQPESEGQPGLDRVVRVRYADEFERRNGQWRIAQRQIIIDHAMAPVSAGPEGFFRGPKARRDAQDPVLEQRAALGITD
jgi:hypothetical protein